MPDSDEWIARVPMQGAPEQISSDVLGLCEKLVPNVRPVFLPVEPAPDAVQLDCYGNVDRVIAKKGGGIQYGWQIWDALPGVMMEAEFHAVWVDDKGVLHDVTPKQGKIDRILFLPDQTRNYEGRQINNVRVALRSDSLIDEHIAAADDYFAYMNKDELANFHGYVTTDDPELTKIIMRQAQSLYRIVEKYYPSS